MKRFLVVLVVAVMLLVGVNAFAANMSAGVGYSVVDRGNSDIKANNSMFVEAGITEYLSERAKVYGTLKFNLDEYGLNMQSRDATAGVAFRALCENCEIDINYNIERFPTGESMNTFNTKATVKF